MTDPRIVLVLDTYQRYVEAGKLDPVYDAARRAKLRTWQDIAGDLVAALRAVLDLHRDIDGDGTCGVCADWNEGLQIDGMDVATGAEWPCSTVAAIAEALGGN